MAKFFGAKSATAPQTKQPGPLEFTEQSLAMKPKEQPMASPAANPIAMVKYASTDVAVSEFEDMPSGLENVTAKDLLIPRLTILQGLSPQLQKSKPEYNADARAGMFCDTGTGDLFDTLHVIPCFYAKIYLEWGPRSSGKGLVMNHGTDDSIMKQTTLDDKKRAVLPNQNYVAETMQFFVMNLTADGRRSFIPLSSTQLKAGRRWLTLITSERLKRTDGSDFMPPMFYRSWSCSSVEQSNNDGTWNGWRMDPGPTILELDPTKRLLERAKEFSGQAKEGLVKGDVESVADEPHANDKM